MLQDAFGNPQQYGATVQNTAFLDIDGRTIELQPMQAALEASFSMAMPGQYSMTVWLQVPAGSADISMLRNTTVTVVGGDAYLPNILVRSIDNSLLDCMRS